MPRSKRSLNKRLASLGLVLMTFGLAGYLALHLTHAATYAVSHETETASITGNVIKSSHNSASGGSTLNFGVPPLTNTVISRNKPAFASSGTASRANDTNYNTHWQSSGGTATLAYDLSSVSPVHRQSILLAWYNDDNFAYEPAFATWENEPRNYPQTYTVETNTAPGGGSAPTSGWATKATVTGNDHHSRQHVIDMANANWVRLNISRSNGSYTKLNMDIYPRDIGLQDDWFFFGSSTPSMSLQHTTIGTVTQNFSELINAQRSGVFPAQENGNTSGMDTNDGKVYLPRYLDIFPGKYVVIGLGANDADICMSNTMYYDNMAGMIRAIQAKGKVAVVPLFNWSPSTADCGQRIVDQTKKLWSDFPAVVHGPDFWSYFKSHPELVSGDGQHPTTTGLAAFRKMWAETALSTVYK